LRGGTAVHDSCRRRQYEDAWLAHVSPILPIQDRTDDEMREIADRAFDAVVAQLVKQG
jgi:hypothetical protein